MGRGVIRDELILKELERMDLGRKTAFLALSRTVVKYHPISSTCPSNCSLGSSIVSPTTKGRLIYSIRPPKKLEMASLAANPNVAAPIPPKAIKAPILRPQTCIAIKRESR